MADQAEQLRERLQRSKTQHRPTRIVAVTSGKGGVGKSNFTLNFALGLIEKGKKILIFDVDLGLANLDVLMGISARKNLLDLLQEGTRVWDIMEKGPNGLEFIAGGSGFTQILQLDEDKHAKIMRELEEIQGYADLVLLDTGAGISQESLRFMLASDEILLVTTPEPTSITDAYAVVKMLHSRNPAVVIKLIVNRASSAKEAKHTAEKLTLVAKQFLGLKLETIGYVLDDPNVSKSVKKQRPFLLEYPGTDSSRNIREVVETYLGSSDITFEREKGGLRGFLHRIKQMIN